MSTDITSMIISKELELVAKGYSQDQASAATKRARRWADSIASKVEPENYDQTFISLFRASLRECEDWLDKTRKTGKKWTDGLEASGATVGPQTREAYEKWSA